MQMETFIIKHILSDIQTQKIIKEFVIANHLKITGYDEQSKQIQLSKLHLSFPEFYDVDVWTKSNCWICMCDDNLIGCVGLKKYNSDTYEIGYLFVDPNYQNKGIGKQLLQTVIDCSKSNQQMKYLRLITLEGLMDSAIKLYKKNGFVIADTKKVECFTVVCMVLVL